MSNTLMTEANKVISRYEPDPVIVGLHQRAFHILELTVYENDLCAFANHFAIGADSLLRKGRGHDQTVRAVQERRGFTNLPRRVFLRIADDNLKSGRPRDRFDTAQKLREIGMHEVRHNHSDEARALCSQGPRVVVWAVVQTARN